jgi:hypothetical protein
VLLPGSEVEAIQGRFLLSILRIILTAFIQAITCCPPSAGSVPLTARQASAGRHGITVPGGGPAPSWTSQASGAGRVTGHAGRSILCRAGAGARAWAADICDGRSRQAHCGYPGRSLAARPARRRWPASWPPLRSVRPAALLPPRTSWTTCPAPRQPPAPSGPAARDLRCGWPQTAPVTGGEPPRRFRRLAAAAPNVALWPSFPSAFAGCLAATGRMPAHPGGRSGQRVGLACDVSQPFAGSSARTRAGEASPAAARGTLFAEGDRRGPGRLGPGVRTFPAKAGRHLNSPGLGPGRGALPGRPRSPRRHGRAQTVPRPGGPDAQPWRWPSLDMAPHPGHTR